MAAVDIVDGHEGKGYWTVDLPMPFLMHTFTTYRCVRNVVAHERKTSRRRIKGGICFRESVDPVAQVQPDTWKLHKLCTCEFSFFSSANVKLAFAQD